MKLFLHCCCGPCAAGSIPQLQVAGYELFAWFYNPNIHPFQEHKSRRLSFVELMEQLGLEYAVNADYPLEIWLKQVASTPEKRCSYCYRSRLEAAAEEAANRGFQAFSSTLLVSPYQNQELIGKIGQEAAARFGIDFVFQDLRPGFRDGQADARERGLYMQKYCGCIYSEKERYAKKARPTKQQIGTED
ncbi:MAG: epoxyqueuosine reductase QueH [Bacillota bacterium]|nr:epoxyqueuosine reductase QueH [Bacillota bacterium]